MDSANYIAVIAIVAEMARCLNKNIAKVHLTPIDSSVVGHAAMDLEKLVDDVAKA